MAAQAMIKGLQHFRVRDLSMVHLMVLMAVELCHKITEGRLKITANQIATFTKMAPEEFQSELETLVDKRYLHLEIEPFVKDALPHYTIGSMGGTILRNMMNRPPKRTRKKQ